MKCLQGKNWHEAGITSCPLPSRYWDEAVIASGHTNLLSSLIPGPTTIECDFFSINKPWLMTQV